MKFLLNRAPSIPLPLEAKRAWPGTLPLVARLAFLWVILVLAFYYRQLWQFQPGGGWQRPLFYGDPRLPFLGEAWWRGITSLVTALLLVGSAVIVGAAISRAMNWRYRNWQERLPATASIGVALFSYIGLALASAGYYLPEIVTLLGVLPWLAAVGWAMMTGYTVTWPSLLPTRRADRLWLAVALLAALFSLVAALAPESEFDALWYHLAYPWRYLQQGFLVDLPEDYVSLYPMTWELWFGYGLALGGGVAAKLLHFACLPLTALIVYELTRRLAPGSSPYLAAALFMTVPIVMWEASTAYIDLALAFHVTLALFALLRYSEQRQGQWLLLGALNLGMATATKHLGLVVLALVCPVLLFHLWRRGAHLRSALGPLLLIVIVALLFPLPWYLRAFLASGNPFFPEMYGLFGADPARWDSVTEQGLQGFKDHFGQARTPLNLLRLPWHLTMHAAAYDGTLGPLFLLLLPLLPLVWKGRTVQRLLLAFVVAYVAIWASPISSFQMRFLLPIVPALSILGAISFGRLRALARRVAGVRVARRWEYGMVLLLLLNLPPFSSLHEGDRNGWSGWLNSTLRGIPLSVVVGAESEEQYLTRTVRSYAVWHFAEQQLPPGARVLSWSNGDQFYTAIDRIWSDATVARSVAWAPVGEEERALRALHGLGITHLIVDRRSPESPDPWEFFALTGPTALATWYDQLYEDRYYVLLELRDTAVPEGPESRMNR